MTKEQTAIGPWLLIPVLIIAAIGHGMLNMPHFVAKAMGNNAYWAFPVAVLLFVGPAMAVIYILAQRFPGQTIIEQGKTILGPFFGTVTGLGYLGCLIFFLAILTRDVVNMASVYFLFQSPIYALALVYLLSAAYLASRGIETITRTASMMLIPALLVLLILTAVGFQNVSLNNLKPVFTPRLSDYLIGAKGAMQNFYMLGFVAMVLPFLKPLNSFPRFAGGTILLLLFFLTLITVGTIGVTGPEFLSRFAYPSLVLFRLINIPNSLLEQAGIIIGIAWLVMILVGTGFGHYAVSLGLSQAIPCWNYKKFVWILVPIKFYLIMLPAGVLATKTIVDFVAQNAWIPLFGYPLFLWIAALIFNKKGVSSRAA